MCGGDGICSEFRTQQGLRKVTKIGSLDGLNLHIICKEACYVLQVCHAKLPQYIHNTTQHAVDVELSYFEPPKAVHNNQANIRYTHIA